MNDIALQVLRDAHRAIHAAKEELATIDAIKQAKENELNVRKAAEKKVSGNVGRQSDKG